jgi:rubrerythrin
VIALRAELAQGLDDPVALQGALQTAIELEHATIPTYLYALFSIQPGKNMEIGHLIKSVVLEEMTHMGLACNILNAIGGQPEIDKPDFIPRYPGPLPGAVESELVVPLSPLTIDLVSDVFMVIEEPQDPLEFRPLAAANETLTIGEFYTAIGDQLTRAGEGIFSGDPARQVTHDLGVEELVAVTDLTGALAAIETIVEQGEGTSLTPTDEDGELAHYYRFAEIFHGRQLVPTPDAPPHAPPDERWSYTGAPIPFDPGGVLAVLLNPGRDSYTAGTAAADANDSFNYTYTRLLKSLHATFNGAPDQLMAAVGLMESLKQQAHTMSGLKVGTGTVAGPSFQYQPTNP